MKNITVSLDDEIYRRARVKAAEMDTSVSAVVKNYLIEFATTETEFERLERQEEEIRCKMIGFRGSDRLSRDELYDRKRTG
jgi:plasmid stability protein